MQNRGFVALVAVVSVASAALIFSATVLAAAVELDDHAGRREARAQASLNAQSCLDAVAVMIYKDVFLKGIVAIEDFECIADISAHAIPGDAAISVRAFASLDRGASAVSVYASKVLAVPDF